MPSPFLSLFWFRLGYHLSVLVLLVIPYDWDFTLSAVSHSVTVLVVTTTGDGQLQMNWNNRPQPSNPPQSSMACAAITQLVCFVALHEI